MVRSFPGLGRLIPAHAGKTACSRRRRRSRPAHPRSRGENPGGKLGDFRARGLIPAHAGKTSRRRAWLACLWAHPRSRGENGKTTLVGPLQVGSSPLTRGKPSAKVTTSLSLGLIPTHARKTLRGSRPPAGSRAHPHSRGENQRIKSVAVSVTGSSPLTRGK